MGSTPIASTICNPVEPGGIGRIIVIISVGSVAGQIEQHAFGRAAFSVQGELNKNFVVGEPYAGDKGGEDSAFVVVLLLYFPNYSKISKNLLTNACTPAIIINVAGANASGAASQRTEYGGIAQLGERLNGIQEVSGSIPLISTKLRIDRMSVKWISGLFFLRWTSWGLPHKKIRLQKSPAFRIMDIKENTGKGGRTMAIKGIHLYAEKKHELEELCEKIQSRMKKELGAELADQVSYRLGETKVLLMTLECWFLRTGSYASLSVLLTEFQGVQGAYIISSGGKEILFSLGAETRFADGAKHALEELGFVGK